MPLHILFAHLPLLLKTSGGKLSKRDGEKRIVKELEKKFSLKRVQKSGAICFKKNPSII